MLSSLLLLLLLAPAESNRWVERIRKDPKAARVLVRGNDPKALEQVVAAFLEAKETKSLDALGWEAVAALPVDSKPGIRLQAHVLTSGVRNKAYVPEGYQVVLGPAPDAEPTLVSLQWESGSGHGFTLTRYRARWSDAGLQVRKMRYFRNVRTDKKQGVITESTLIPRRRAEVVLRVVLAATALELEKLEGLHTMSGSTADFHAMLRIDSDRRIFSKQFTGYRGSSKAPRYVALRVCNSLLNEALATCKWRAEAPTEGDLADLAQRMSTLAAESWWVRERLILMAGMIGDKRCLPALEAQIRRALGLTSRAHRYAINAYARISGVDFRPKDFESEPVRPTRAKYLAFFDRH
ncbi:MAG: hypothetical protein ACYTEG_05750 [Planctomycetota bacterium]